MHVGSADEMANFLFWQGSCSSSFANCLVSDQDQSPPDDVKRGDVVLIPFTSLVLVDGFAQDW